MLHGKELVEYRMIRDHVRAMLEERERDRLAHAAGVRGADGHVRRERRGAAVARLWGWAVGGARRPSGARTAGPRPGGRRARPKVAAAPPRG